MQHHSASLIALALQSNIGVLKGRQLLLIPLALALQLLGNFLLKNKSFEGIITLLLSAGQTDRKASVIILLLVNETCKASVLTLVALDLDFEIRCLLGELLS